MDRCPICIYFDAEIERLEAKVKEAFIAGYGKGWWKNLWDDHDTRKDRFSLPEEAYKEWRE